MAVRIEPGLHDCYESCRRLHRRRDPTPHWATCRPPHEVRPAVHALYALVRGRRRGRRAWPRAGRSAPLRALLWEEAAAHARGPGTSGGGGARRCRRPAPRPPARRARPVLRLDALRLRTGARAGPGTSERYAAAPARWAASWARCSAHREASASRSSASLGAAFQLTNFVRDVREDWELDRVYMPAEDSERFGVSTTQIASREPTPGFRACSP